MREKLIYVLGAAAAILLVRNLNIILNVLPDEANQGAMYRILFFHVPSWWTAGLALMLSAGTSVAYLWTGKLRYDAISVSVTEVAVVFLCIGLTTGSIWARIIWGIWWTWDARLTTAFVCFLLYRGYLLQGHGSPDQTPCTRISAVFLQITFPDFPIGWFSIPCWRTPHPQPMKP